MRFHLIGDSLFENNFYDEDYQSGGVTMNIFFALHYDDEDWPKLVIDGPGTLTLSGGLDALYCEGDIDIKSDITIRPKEGRTNSGIRSDHDIHIFDGLNIDIDARGTGIEADNLTIDDDVTLNIHSKANTVAHGRKMFSAAGLFAATDLSCGASEISIRMEADSDEFISMENILSGFHGMSYFGTGTFDGSSVLVEIDIPEAADPVSFANNVSRINGRSVSEEVDLKLMNKAEVVIINNAEHANGVAGIYTTGNLEVEDDCHLSAVATGRNRVLGISVDGDMTVGNGTVNGEAHSAGIYPESIEEGVYQVIGLFAQNFNVNT